MRRTLPTALVLILGSSAVFGQAEVAPPIFEVAAIKPCVSAPSGGRGGGEGRTGGDSVSSGRLNLCRTVFFFINLAYVTFANGDRDLPDFVPITGGPAWINSDQYNINAKAEGNPSPQMMQGPMLQALLEDRFKLKIRREIRSEPIYALTVAKGGAKLAVAKECTPIDTTKPPEPVRSGQRQYCGSPRKSGIILSGGSNITFDSHGVSLDEFSKSLASILGRPVVNKTGLAGEFDFDLEFQPDESTAGLRLRLPASDGVDAPSVFTALQEQLGLKIESTRGTGEFLVIDSAERPSEN
jgi:uncharacterized protein (TIGR03435 family)